MNGLNRFRLASLLAVLFVLGVARPAVAGDAVPPNFVVIVADDVGWDAFGCTGSKWARTPNIDELSKRSLHMQRYYCSVSQCGPLRAEMYTGLLPNRNGVLANGVKLKRPGVKNVADHLRPLGYRVGWTGKKHFKLGTAELDNIEGFPSNGNASNQTYRMDGVEAYAKAALEAGDPFCIFICSIHAHHPWDHGDEAKFQAEALDLPPHYIDTPDTRAALAKHAAEVEVLDRQVGDTLALLKSMGISDNTVLIFLSEQGIAMPRGKWSPYDYGSRALCLAHWPGQIKPRKTSAIAMYCDLVPTLIDLGGGEPDAGLDGLSMRDAWLGTKDTHRDAAFISNVHPFWQKAIVTSDYKLIWTGHPEREHIYKNFRSKGKFFSRPWTQWEQAAAGDEAAAAKLDRVRSPARLELYRIDQDPYEVNDLAGQPEHAKTVAELHNQLKALMKEAGEPMKPKDRGQQDKSRKK